MFACRIQTGQELGDAREERNFAVPAELRVVLFLSLSGEVSVRENKRMAAQLTFEPLAEGRPVEPVLLLRYAVAPRSQGMVPGLPVEGLTVSQNAVEIENDKPRVLPQTWKPFIGQEQKPPPLQAGETSSMVT